MSPWSSADDILITLFAGLGVSAVGLGLLEKDHTGDATPRPLLGIILLCAFIIKFLEMKFPPADLEENGGGGLFSFLSGGGKKKKKTKKNKKKEEDGGAANLGGGKKGLRQRKGKGNRE